MAERPLVFELERCAVMAGREVGEVREVCQVDR